MLTESTGALKPVAVIIVGADTVLAARPATPIQLWHACAAAGYDLAVPATWGDELIAGESLRSLGGHPEQVAVMCSCPLVARVVAEMPFDMSAHLVMTVAPPVATAKYLRRVYGDRRVHLTYAGACPAAADSAIDAWITPAELLARFRETEIVIEEQPEFFESVLPPDRRRHLSQPGGLPAAEQVATMARPRRVQPVTEEDLAVAIERHLASGVRSVVDVAPRAGCSCSGAIEGLSPAEARSAVTVLEPPRSARPVMADPGGLGLSRRLPVRQPARAVEPSARPQPPFPPAAAPRPERERPPAVATRAATRSPLSWHLRERALPQPPTTSRPERPAPEGVRPTGASSAGWGAAPDRGPSHEPSADSVTAAAVRALEQAAAKRASRSKSAASDDATPAQLSALGGTAERASVELPAGQEGKARAPLADLPTQAAPNRAEAPEPKPGIAPPHTTAREPTRTSEAPETRPPRTTPAGGYWFAAPIVAPTSDAEIKRPAATVDVLFRRPDAGGEAAPAETADALHAPAARDDTPAQGSHPSNADGAAVPEEGEKPGASGEAGDPPRPDSAQSEEEVTHLSGAEPPDGPGRPDDHIDVSALSEPAADDSLPDPTTAQAAATERATLDAARGAQPGPRAETEPAPLATAPVEDATAVTAIDATAASEPPSPETEDPRTADTETPTARLEPPANGNADAGIASAPRAPEEDRQTESALPEPATGTLPPPATDDIRAQLDELFRTSELSAGAQQGTGGAQHAATALAVSVPAPAAPTTAAPVTAPAAPTAAPVTAPARPSAGSGPLPWKWIVGAAILIVAAVAISRQVNSRVTTEETGATAQTVGAGAPSGLIAPGALPAVSESAPPAAETPDRSGPRRAPTANLPRGPRGRATPTAAPDSPDTRTGPAALGNAGLATGVGAAALRDSARRDSLARDSSRLAVPSRPDTGARPALSAREIELQAIRDELAQRRARLDSMGRALGSLYVAPRRPPAGPPIPPPRLRDPRH